MDMISLAVSATPGRLPFLRETLKSVAPMVDEVVIAVDSKGNEEHEFLRNDTLNAFDTKRIAVGNCKNDWVILMDSDNEIYQDYIDAIRKIDWQEDTIYCPEIAIPNYNFSKFNNLLIYKNNIRKYIDDPEFKALLLTGNYFFNKRFYLLSCEFSQGQESPADAMALHYYWLKAGGKIMVVPGLKYIHRSFEDSYFKANQEQIWADVEKFKSKFLSLEKL